MSTGASKLGQANQKDGDDELLVKALDLCKTKRYREAFPIVTAVAQRGNPAAQCMAGYMCLRAKGVEKNYSDAMTWFQKAAGQSAEACRYLGLMYQTGKVEDGTCNLEKALEWYSKAEELGDKKASYKIRQIERQMQASFNQTQFFFHRDGPKNLLAQSMDPSNFGVSNTRKNSVDLSRGCPHFNRRSEKSAERGQISRDLPRQYRDIDPKSGEIGTPQVILQPSIEMRTAPRSIASLYSSPSARNTQEIKLSHSALSPFLKNLIKLDWKRRDGAFNLVLNSLKIKEKVKVLVELGDIYAKGTGVDINHLKAKHFYVMAYECAKENKLPIEAICLKLGDIYCGRHIRIAGSNGGYQMGVYEKGAEWYVKAAEEGSGVALIKLGDLYFQGHLSPLKGKSHYESAKVFYTKASKKGVDIGLVKVGDLYWQGHLSEPGESPNKKYEDAKLLYLQAANRHSALGCLKLGFDYYYKSKEPQPDYEQAIFWCKKSVDLGEVSAFTKLMEVVDKANNAKEQSTQISEAEQVEQLKKSADEGNNSVAKIELGRMNLTGTKYVPKNVLKAIDYFRAAYDKGHFNSAYMLGNAYLQLPANLENTKAAVSWFEIASAAGNNEASFKIAEIGMQTRNWGADDKKIIEFLELAYRQGHKKAPFVLANWYDKRSFLPNKNDHDAAIKWYVVAAEKGDTQAAGVLQVLAPQHEFTKSIHKPARNHLT